MSVLEKIFSKKVTNQPQPSQNSKLERRNCPRIQDFQVTRVFFPDRSFIPVIVEDISLGGVRLFPRGELGLHQKFGLTLKYNGQELRFLIRTLWRRIIEGRTFYGAEFVSSDEDVEHLEKYIENIKWKENLFKKKN